MFTIAMPVVPLVVAIAMLVMGIHERTGNMPQTMEHVCLAVFMFFVSYGVLSMLHSWLGV